MGFRGEQRDQAGARGCAAGRIGRFSGTTLREGMG